MPEKSTFIFLSPLQKEIDSVPSLLLPLNSLYGIQQQQTPLFFPNPYSA